MNSTTDKTIVFLSRSIDDERATVAWTLANAGIANGQDVTVFCVSAGVDVLRRGAADVVQMNPHDRSMKELIGNFMAAGGTVWACPPCSTRRRTGGRSSRWARLCRTTTPARSEWTPAS